jgi:hypothetical protein
MPTTIIKSIRPAGGGDYTSLNSCEAANQQNLVTGDKIFVFEVYSGGNSLTACLSIGSSWTTDATHYIEIRAATGHQHVGIYDENKAYGAHTTTGFEGAIKPTGAADIHIINMQVKLTISGGSQGAPIMPYGSSGITTIDKCIVVCVASDNTLTACFFSSTRIDLTNSICTSYTPGNNCNVFWVEYGTVTCTINNCTLVGYSASSVAVIGAQINPVVNSQNNYLKGTTCYANGGGATLNKGANDATSNANALTASLRNIAYTTANFISVTQGSEDLHLKAASILTNSGADLSGAGVVQDIDGEDRFTPYSIGADQPKKAGGFFAFLTSIW